MNAKKRTCLLLMCLAVAAGYIVYATCEEQPPPFWSAYYCWIEPENRVNVSSGQTVRWEGAAIFYYFEWWELAQHYVPTDECNERDSSMVENRWRRQSKRWTRNG